MEDVKKIESVVSDMRKFLRQHPRIIQRLHRRVFLDGVNRDQVQLGSPKCSWSPKQGMHGQWGSADGELLCSLRQTTWRRRARSHARLSCKACWVAGQAGVMLLGEQLPLPAEACCMWQITVYISCYVEATNRDAFMAVRQDIMIAFVELVHGKDCELARTRLGVSSPASSHCCVAALLACARALRCCAITIDTWMQSLPAATCQQPGFFSCSVSMLSISLHCHVV